MDDVREARLKKLEARRSTRPRSEAHCLKAKRASAVSGAFQRAKEDVLIYGVGF